MAFRKHSPLLLVITIYLVFTGLILAAALKKTDGQLIYPLDDTYIHMEMAKNLVQHGVWGITPYGFSSSTSSPLWTGLLALTFLLTGVHTVTPLVLNLLIGVGLIVSVDLLLRKYFPLAGRRAWLLFFLVLATPLPTLTFIGMEHLLHAMLAVWFLALAARDLSTQGTSKALVPLAFLLPLARYESLFLIGIVVMLFALRKRWGAALTLAAAAALSVTAYGLWSVANGWYFLPNSVLVKANTSALHPGTFGLALGFVFVNLFQAPTVLALILMAGLTLKFAWSEKPLRILTFGLVAVCQLLLARTGWLYRYEAYLVVLGVIALAPALPDLFQPASLPRRIAYALTAILFAASFGYRMQDALTKTVQASFDTFRQQFQMAAFVQRYYPSATIVINDIGAISFYTDAHIVDLVGLASMDAARARLNGTFSTETIRSLSMDARIAIVYENWYDLYGGLPAEWVKLGEWTIPDTAMIGHTVSFYALTPSEQESLKAHLAEYGVP